jgi:ATP-dependent metalloprotease
MHFPNPHCQLVMGPQRKALVLPKHVMELTAYHEGGHALVAALTEGASEIRKATILPRGLALGMVSYLQNEDQGSMSKRQMLARIDIAMGGRAAEELIYGRG